MGNKKEYYKTSMSIDFFLDSDSQKCFKEAIASYIDELPENDENSPYIKQLNTLVLKQPDLLHALSILCSIGENKNRDVFLGPVLCSIYKTIRNKFVDYEHDKKGENKKGKNPNKYQTVGHIYDSALALQSGEMIPESEIVKDDDGKWFLKDSKWRGQLIDVLAAWVIYSFVFPEIVDTIMMKTETDPLTFGVSMEILYDDYKYRVGDFDPWEEFDFDATTIGLVEGKPDKLDTKGRVIEKGTALGNMLEEMFKKRLPYDGKPIHKILGGEIFFSGMAVTSNRANKRSFNLSLDGAFASVEEDSKEPTVLDSLLMAVASRDSGPDLSQCRIINGEPDCECVKNAAIDEIEELITSTASFLSIANDPIKKIVEVGGVSIGLEWLKGEERKYKDNTMGLMKSDYGYVLNTKSNFDGEEIDCYVGPNYDCKEIYRLTQLKGDGTFDEFKFMVGYENIEEAEKAYLAQMPGNKFGGTDTISLEDFKTIVQTSFEKFKSTMVSVGETIDFISNSLSKMIEDEKV